MDKSCFTCGFGTSSGVCMVMSEYHAGECRESGHSNWRERECKTCQTKRAYEMILAYDRCEKGGGNGDVSPRRPEVTE